MFAAIKLKLYAGLAILFSIGIFIIKHLYSKNKRLEHENQMVNKHITIVKNLEDKKEAIDEKVKKAKAVNTGASWRDSI